ncbi:MAG: acyl-CoA mutase large subunit family protein [Synergistaceae bacterium]|jgi:methylmalonyl-CoA mutase|nr:acyl-CoA mutase large subunit family protein [Synergistaceae bacterium]
MEECTRNNNAAETPGMEPPEVDFSEFAPSSYEEWKSIAIATLKDASFDKSMFTKTYEGITLEPLYTMDHSPITEAARSLPGDSPAIRGARASGYLAGPWEIAQDSTGSTVDETASLTRHELEKGSTAITLLAGAGTPINSSADVKKILSGADLARHTFHVLTGASSAPIKYFTNAAKELGFSASDLSGCIGSDPIGSYLRTGAIPKEFPSLMDEMADAIKSAKESSPKLRVVLLRGAVYHDGGANAAQETAYVMAGAIEIIYALQERGLDIDDFAGAVRFEFEQGSNFFMEIAKIRAAREVWSRVVSEFSGGNPDPGSARANIFGRTSFFTKTYYDPYVNMLRNSTEAFSAVMGGVDGLTVGCFDEAVRAGDEFSRRVARNAQIMLQEEFHLTAPADPAGGSWYIESITDSLANKIWETIQDVQSRGGMLACVKSGCVQNAVNEVLLERFKKLSTRSDRAVGTNMYPNLTETPLPGAGHIEAPSAPSGTDITPILPRRWTEQFEQTRRRTDDYKSRTGSNVRIFLANMGPVSQHKARADFITGFMEVAGYEILTNNGYATTDECADAAISSGADIAVICSADATYPELVPPLARRVKEKKPSMKVFLAGAPAEEHKQSYTDAGVDDFISVRSNCLSVLNDIQKAKGMK